MNNKSTKKRSGRRLLYITSAIYILVRAWFRGKERKEEHVKKTEPAPSPPAVNIAYNQTTENYKARPLSLPEPTYWPFFLAMGVAFIGWGLISTWIIAAGGLVICAIALGGWVSDLRKENKDNLKM